MMESGFQDQIRQELRGRSAELNNLRSNGQSRKIFIVSKFWHDSLMDFIKEPAANAFDDKESASNIINNNSTNPPFPGPIDNTSLCLSNGEFDTKKIYKKDFMIVEASIWNRLVEIFSCKSPVARRLSVHPITSCTVVLLDPIILEMETSKETRIKTCSADWFVGDIRRPLCVVFRFVYADHTFVSYETNEVIPDTMTIGDYVKKFGNKIRLVEKAQVAEIQQIYSSSKNAKSKNSNNYSKSPFPHNYDTFTQANNISNNYSNNYSNNKSNYSNYSGNSSCSSSYNSTNSGYVSGNSSSNSSCLSSYNNKNLMKLKLTSTLQNLTFQIDEGSEIITVNPNSTKHSSSTYQIKHPNPVGLINNGNTCYFNASLQCIIRLPPLYQFVMSPGFSATINKNNPHGSGGVIAREFATLIEMMCAASNSARDPRQLRKVVAFKYKEFADNKQHDAQEMIGAILDGLHEDLNHYHYDSDNFSPSTDNNPTMATISNSNCDNMLNNSMNPNINNNMNNDLNNGLNSCVINGVNKCSNSTNSVMFGNMENMNKINENENQTMIRSRFSLTPRSRMYKSMNPTAPSSIIEELFFGHLETKTICPNCEEVETINDPFLFLSLPIPQNVVGEVPLESCVKKFICSGQLDENNKWRCPKCNINVCANQNMEIKFVSRILIIHLKRFVVLNGFSSKNDTKVVYPAKIDISQIAPKCTGTYKLVSVVFHSGSLSRGHYTSAAVDPSTGKWYSFNDSYSKLASPNVIFSPRAYILFYMRVEK